MLEEALPSRALYTFTMERLASLFSLLGFSRGTRWGQTLAPPRKNKKSVIRSRHAEPEPPYLALFTQSRRQSRQSRSSQKHFILIRVTGLIARMLLQSHWRRNVSGQGGGGTPPTFGPILFMQPNGLMLNKIGGM